jgi:hypothetical protein
VRSGYVIWTLGIAWSVKSSGDANVVDRFTCSACDLSPSLAERMFTTVDGCGENSNPPRLCPALSNYTFAGKQLNVAHETGRGGM